MSGAVYRTFSSDPSDPSLAATIFNLYVASDTASDSFAGLKRLHGIMPYFVMKGILRISNPIAMIRGILDLFLARPFGGQSLLQRMFSQSLTEDVRYLTEDINAVADKVDDPVLCQKIEEYVNAPFEIQEIIRRDAVQENHDLLVVILRSPEMPALSRPQMQRVFKASRAYRQYKADQAEWDDSDDEGPDNDDAWLFEDLNILMKLMQRRREKEAMISLIFEGVTAELLKDIITIFYSPLAQVYKAANIADSLGDLQAFINDMIRTVEQVEECEWKGKPSNPSVAGGPRQDCTDVYRPRPAPRTGLLHVRAQRACQGRGAVRGPHGLDRAVPVVCARRPPPAA